MKYDDILLYTWFKEDMLGYKQYDYKKYFYKTDIKIGDKDLILGVWTNENHPWMYDVTLLRKEYWEVKHKNIIEKDPPEGEIKAFRECLKYLFEEELK